MLPPLDTNLICSKLSTLRQSGAKVIRPRSFSRYVIAIPPNRPRQSVTAEPLGTTLRTPE
ncbi:MAG: hypothetical protein NT138_01625 [Planctomycetales bacterium]|nr:hypothetical protein [Planctomycetales bacterium]